MTRLVAVACLVLAGCASPVVAETVTSIGGTTTTSTSTSTTSVPTATTEPVPTFTASIGPVAKSDLPASWQSGCPVGADELRRLELAHWDMDGQVATGALIVAAEVTDDLVGVFEVLFDLGFPIERMVPVDQYGADDEASMAANNTSAFNCRAVTGGSSWSQHSYGWAIDINPVQNPYVRGLVLPPAGDEFLDREDPRPGMVTQEVVDAFAAIGWSWGGDWSSPDYQHFSLTGR